MLEIAVCEDEQADRDRLCSMLGVILNKQEIEHRITCYGSGEELLGADITFQLVFLDIIMDGKNGIEVGGRSAGRTGMSASFIRLILGNI